MGMRLLWLSSRGESVPCQSAVRCCRVTACVSPYGSTAESVQVGGQGCFPSLHRLQRVHCAAKTGACWCRWIRCGSSNTQHPRIPSVRVLRNRCGWLRVKGWFTPCASLHTSGLSCEAWAAVIDIRCVRCWQQAGSPICFFMLPPALPSFTKTLHSCQEHVAGCYRLPIPLCTELPPASLRARISWPAVPQTADDLAFSIALSIWQENTRTIKWMWADRLFLKLGFTELCISATTT